jgi:nitrate reductase (NAD(P)H)
LRVGQRRFSVHALACKPPVRLLLAAWLQNGRWLTPDHGFPVRIVIPGFIGGRMVKWLCEITVEEKESQNHYHFFDNRVLPSHVDQELATKEGEC